ncbi:MAG: hypothetical protein U0167_14065 [bacterium]
MRTSVGAFGLLAWLWIGSTAPAQTSVFFQEGFSGPTLDPSTWRTEILTSGVRWCDFSPDPGYWVGEGSDCRGVAVYSPYGSAILSDGSLHFSSSNGRAFPYLVSRLPGATPLFPGSGDFTFKARMHFDRITPWGTFLMVLQVPSTDPSGDNDPFTETDRLLQIASNGLYSALSGSISLVAGLPSPTTTHEVSLVCVGNKFTIKIDGQIVYGPVASTMRPNAVWMGNPAVAYWYSTDWTSFSVDDIRVELPGPPEGACCFANFCLEGTETACRGAGGHYLGDGTTCDPDPCGPTAVEATTWGRLKAVYRE